MLQQDKPEDYVIATGETHTVRECVEVAADELGIKITWEGKGQSEKGINTKTGESIIEIDPSYFRPAEVDLLLGDPTKAQKQLKWKTEYDFDKLIREMAKFDLENEASGKYTY
jgi:GDPmannose 4,6-dehydratase